MEVAPAQHSQFTHEYLAAHRPGSSSEFSFAFDDDDRFGNLDQFTKDAKQHAVGAIQAAVRFPLVNDKYLRLQKECCSRSWRNGPMTNTGSIDWRRQRPGRDRPLDKQLVAPRHTFVEATHTLTARQTDQVSSLARDPFGITQFM